MNHVLMTVRRATALVASLATAGLLTLAVPADAGSARPDADRDGMPNSWEIKHHLNPHKANAKGDKDADGLRNLGEYKHGTDPEDVDTDDDGLDDEDEVEDCTVTTDPEDEDTDDDGIDDGDEDTDDDGVDNADDDDDQGEDCDDQGEDDDDRVLVTYSLR
jgi:hypothetical protein